MRTYSLLSLGLTLAVGLACELKISPEETDTSDDGSSTGAATDAGGTEGVSSGTVGTSGQTSGGSSATATTASTTVSTTTGEMTTGGDPTATSSTSATSMTSATSNTSGDPVVPTPCEGVPTPIQANTIAYLESQVPPVPDTTGGSSGTGGDPPNPATLHVRLSSQSLTCKDPQAILQCGPEWAVSINIPPEFQTPGLYHLAGPDVIGIGMETGADEGNGECSFGGGSFFATLEIISVDEVEVTGRLCHVEGPLPSNFAALEGSFVAPRCP